MKLNFKKITAIGASLLMTGLTAGVAAAANFPAPFVENGADDVAIVYGGGALSLDAAPAGSILTALQDAMPATGSTTTITGESIDLASGSDYLYLNDDLSENVQIITKSNLPNTLADGTFTDDDGTDYDYEQLVTIGTSTLNNVAFGDSDNDFDDPAIMLDMSTASGTPMYTWSATFDTAVPFNATDSEGEELSLFGKTYTVGTATDADTLVLLGGSDSTTVNVGETKTLDINGESYTVELTGISSATTAQAGIIVNADTKTFTQGQTKTVGGIDVYVKTVFRTGDNTGYIEIQLGADKLTLESGNAVQYGSDNTDIDGTLVTITGGVNATTAMTIAVAADDSDNNHVLMGESFTDPIFETLSLIFSGANNAPMIEDHKDVATDRGLLEISKGGDRELELTFTDAAGITKTVPFTYQGALTDNDGNAISIVEGATIADDGYFILNSGSNQHLMQITHLNIDSSDYIGMKDLVSGTTYSTTSTHDWVSDNTDTLIISGQTYTLTNVSTTGVTITSSDYSTNVAVYPYIELVSGEDHRFAFTDEVTVFDDATAASDKTVELPTGSVTFAFTDVTAGDCSLVATPSGGTAITLAVNSTLNAATGVEDTMTVGSVDYVVWANETGADGDTCAAVDVTIALEATQSATGDVQETDPAILFVEDEDKSEATTSTKNAVILATTDSTYSTSSNPVFTSTGYDTDSFDDSDYVGYLTNFGTYVLKDSSDTNQAFTSLTYPEEPMYFDVAFAEADATVTSGGASALGDVMVMDSEIASVQDKNLVLVGGSCINTATATALGGAYCGEAFTSMTGVGTGQFMIKGYDGAFTTGKLALVVAGYDAADTVNAATYLKTQTVDTSAEYIGTTGTTADLIVA